MGNNLAAALAGALRGGVGVQRDRRERSRELEDQEAQTQALLARMQLQARLQQALQQAGFKQENLAREDTQTFTGGQAGLARTFAGNQAGLDRTLTREEGGAGRGVQALLGLLRESGATNRLGQELGVRVSEGKLDRIAAGERATTMAGAGGTLLRTPEGELVNLPRGGDPSEIPAGSVKLSTRREELSDKERERAEEKAIARLLPPEKALLAGRMAKEAGMSLLNYAVNQGLVDREEAEQVVLEEESRIAGGGISAADQEILDLQKVIADGFKQLQLTEE